MNTTLQNLGNALIVTNAQIKQKKYIRKRSDLEKHLTLKNCDSTFLKNILRFKKLKR